MTIVLFCRSKVVAIDVEEPFQEGRKEELGYLFFVVIITNTTIDPGCNCIKTPTLGLCLAGPLWKSNSEKNVGKLCACQRFKF